MGSEEGQGPGQGLVSGQDAEEGEAQPLEEQDKEDDDDDHDDGDGDEDISDEKPRTGEAETGVGVARDVVTTRTSQSSLTSCRDDVLLLPGTGPEELIDRAAAGLEVISPMGSEEGQGLEEQPLEEQDKEGDDVDDGDEDRSDEKPQEDEGEEKVDDDDDEQQQQQHPPTITPFAPFQPPLPPSSMAIQLPPSQSEATEQQQHQNDDEEAVKDTEADEAEQEDELRQEEDDEEGEEEESRPVVMELEVGDVEHPSHQPPPQRFEPLSQLLPQQQQPEEVEAAPLHVITAPNLANEAATQYFNSCLASATSMLFPLRDIQLEKDLTGTAEDSTGTEREQGGTPLPMVVSDDVAAAVSATTTSITTTTPAKVSLLKKLWKATQFSSKTDTSDDSQKEAGEGNN